MKNMYTSLTLIVLLFVFNSDSFAKDYWSGEIRTRESFLYGRIEVRMKTVEASGVTSTLFTYNTGSSTYNEIDIEIMGKDKNEAQYTTWTPDQSHDNHREILHFNPHAAFHVHAIEWTPDYVAWFVDGHEVHRDNSERMQTLYLPQAIMMNFWIPNSIDWAGAFSETSLPLYAMYDWIKYYEYTPGVNNNFTLKWSDDFTVFDNNRWIKSASTFGSNLCDFVPQNVLIKDGYLLLGMTKKGTTATYTEPINDTDIDAPYPMGGWIFDDQMMIEFSEEVDEASAENLSNYILLSLKLSEPNLLDSKRKILFKVEGAENEKTYPVYFRGIKDLAPVPNTSALEKINMQSGHALPMIIDIGNTNTSDGFLKEQQWYDSLEYGTIGGNIKVEAGVPDTAEYASLCKNGLEGISFFRQRLHNGSYNVKMFFVETENTASGARVFDIYANGQKRISGLDIFNEAGANTVVEKNITGIQVDDNLLEFSFNAKSGLSILHGLIIQKDTTTSVESGEVIPDELGLQTYPNPFNSTANIRFTLDKQMAVKILVYDILGKLCGELVSGKYDAGEHMVQFNSGSYSSGVYFITMVTPGRTLSKKIICLK